MRKKDEEAPLFSGERILCENCGYPKRFFSKKERLICDNCGYWVYKDEITRLKYKNKEAINKIKSFYV